MSVANQTGKQTTSWHGRAIPFAIAAGALVLIMLTAMITSIVLGGLAPRIGNAEAPAAVGGPTNAGLVEFRRGERGLESVVNAAPNSALEEFRRGEQGGTVGASTDANPDPALVEFRRGEQGT